MEWHLIAIGAGIGYLTNHLALKMLFLPRQPIKIGRFTIQGLFPKKWPTMIGETLEGIQEVLPWYIKMPLIRQKIGHDIRQNLEEYDASKLEKTVYSEGLGEIRIIEGLGALIGLLVGLVAALF